MIGILSYVVPILFGVSGWTLACKKYQVQAPHLRAACFAVCIIVGLGIISLSEYFVLVLTNRFDRSTVFGIDGMLSVLLLTVVFRLKKKDMKLLWDDLCGAWRFSSVSRRLSRFYLIMALAACLITPLWIWLMPRQHWDVWITWEQHARFVYRFGAQYWRSLFVQIAPGDGWLRHTDYPFLWPLTMARAWVYAGREWPYLTIGPIVMVLLAGQYMVTAFVREMCKSERLALFAGILMLAHPVYFYWITIRYADGPIAVYMLCAASLLVLGSRVNQKSQKVFQGLSALCVGCALFTKNEGFLFLVSYTSVFLLSRPTLRNKLLVALCIAPFLIGVIIHKVWIAPPGDLTLMVLTAKWPQLFQLYRYGMIAAYLSKHIAISTLTIVTFFLIFNLSLGRWRRDWWMIYAISGLQFVGYMGIYLLTPYSIQWHLQTSFERIWVQLWPILTLCIVLLFNAEASPPQQNGSTQSAKPRATRRAT